MNKRKKESTKGLSLFKIIFQFYCHDVIKALAMLKQFKCIKFDLILVHLSIEIEQLDRYAHLTKDIHTVHKRLLQNSCNVKLVYELV